MEEWNNGREFLRHYLIAYIIAHYPYPILSFPIPHLYQALKMSLFQVLQNLLCLNLVSLKEFLNARNEAIHTQRHDQLVESRVVLKQHPISSLIAKNLILINSLAMDLIRCVRTLSLVYILTIFSNLGLDIKLFLDSDLFSIRDQALLFI